MKFKVESDSAYDDPFSIIYDSVEELTKDFSTSQCHINPCLQEFLNNGRMDSMTINFGDEWYKYSRVYS